MILRKAILLFCLLIICPTVLLADHAPRVLLIDSDKSIEKYRVAHEEFKKAIGYPVIEVNLDGRQSGKDQVEKLLSGEPFSLIYCVGANAYSSAYDYSNKTNIVFTAIINWLRLPVNDHIYGISNEFHPLMQVMLFRYVFPKVEKIGVLYTNKFNQEWFEKARNEAKNVGVEIIGQSVQDKELTVIALQTLLPKIDALWLISDPMIISTETTLINLFEKCDKIQIPIFSYNDIFLNYGAVMIVSVDYATIGRQAAGMAEKLIKGADVGEKIQPPAGSNISLNLKKAKEYGLKYSAAALDSVNHIIQ